jgi:hypothetical protein
MVEIQSELAIMRRAAMRGKGAPRHAAIARSADVMKSAGLRGQVTATREWIRDMVIVANNSGHSIGIPVNT